MMSKTILNVKYYGNILSIYEKTDRWHSCREMRTRSGANVVRFKEIELNTGIKHGFLYKALDKWIEPAAQWAQHHYDDIEAKGLSARIDSLLDAPTAKPFNGIVVVAQNGATRYARCMGYSDVDSQKSLKLSDRFVVGSISKQFTAVLMLLAYDKGLVKLDVPIKTYLPDLRYSWADSITIHHLLTHTHGIDEENPSNPLKFRPGSKFEYNQHGFFLMSVILMRMNGKPFVALADSMFRECGMMNTYCPTFRSDSNLVNGYEEQGGRMRLVSRKETYEMKLKDSSEVIPAWMQISNMLIPAGGFVSSAQDLVLWNQALHNGKLLKKSTYDMMVTKQKNAVRDHPLFGKTAYGYGLTIDDGGPLQLGQTGRLPGFASMDYYFPETGTSVVVLDNMPYYAGDVKNGFQYHLEILKMVRAAN
jgi:D-alanyl-D-alanine carboxypeptidase